MSTPAKHPTTVNQESVDLRDSHEPNESDTQLPPWMLATFLVLAMWGGWYIGAFDGGFQINVYDGPAAFVDVDYASGGRTQSEPLDPVKLGKRVFNTCVTCHQANGEGIEGKYPPLNKSEWVAMDDRILARIVLKGLQGPIEVQGQTYNNQMPAWKQLSDYDIAAVLTHVRQSWDNDLPPVAPSTITKVREEIADQTTPYDPADLLKLELPAVDPANEDVIAMEYANAGDVATMAEIDEDKWIKNLKESYVLTSMTDAVGDPTIGEGLFITATCITCHVDSANQKAIAPSLQGVSQRLKREEIIDSILHPSNKIAEGYGGYKFLDYDERVIAGAILEETDDLVRIRKPSGEIVELAVDDILERMEDTTSPMPMQLVDTLTIQQFADLIAYLESLPPDPNAKPADEAAEPTSDEDAAATEQTADASPDAP